MPLRSPRLRRILLLAALAALASLLLSAAGAGADALTPENEGGSGNAENIDNLYKLVLGLAIVVFLGVEGALIYALVKYKARKGRVAEQIHGNTRLEVGWTVGAGLILVVITIFTFIELGGIKNPPANPSNGYQADSGALYASVDQPEPPNGGAGLNVLVNGQQYLWRFTYDLNRNHRADAGEPYTYDTMTAPQNTTITMDITAQDVAHSWWIPKLGGKFDAIPGHTNQTWFKVQKLGEYPGQCAELCGRNHANMLARVRVVPKEQFASFIDTTAKQIEQANAAGAAQRRALDPINAQTQPSGSASAATGSSTP